MSRPAFPIDEVARYPSPGNIAPGGFAFSPDDSILTFLYSPEHNLSRQLFGLDIHTGEQRLFVEYSRGLTEENISQAEALRRERQRELATGITHFEWASIGNRVLIPLPDGLYIQEGWEAPLHKILDIGDEPVLDPQLSPDGKWVSYVQNAELYIVPAHGGEPRQLTFGGREAGKSNGLAEYIAQEEMGRIHGYWWSEDSNLLAFEEVDETHIPVYRIMHQGKHIAGEQAQEEHRYPFAGQPNAKVRLGVIPIEGGEPVWMHLENFEYLARVNWMPDGTLVAQLQNRDQTRLDLICFDTSTGSFKILLTEENDIWINLHDMFKPLPAKHVHYPGGFIWASERSGYMHLYLYDHEGNLVRQLTRGEWVVDGIAGVDASKERIYFTGRMESPLESHLYSVSFAGEEPRRITRQIGIHRIVLDHNFKYFVDVHDSLRKPPHVSLCRLSTGARQFEVYSNDDPRVTEYGLQPPELVTLQNSEGITLQGALYRPHTRSKKPLPTIIFVYGGPQAQMVTNTWQMTSSMRVQYLRELGYVVFVLDNRGSAKRGLAFEGCVKHDLGNLEVKDQVAGVHWLVEKGIADPARVGIYGWSYGGYMSAMCLCRAPETFTVAVAGAPVSNWDGYDTHYTERYMGTPGNNPEGYKVSDVMYHVDKMQGKLMLVHGMIDENVHFQHTARLINSLIHSRKRYSLLVFPDERHSPRKLEDRVFMEEQIRDFIIENL